MTIGPPELQFWLGWQGMGLLSAAFPFDSGLFR